MRGASNIRERSDFRKDIKRYTSGKTLEQVIAGQQDGLIVIGPRYGHVRFTTNYPTAELMAIGENDANRQLDIYFNSPERQQTLKKIQDQSARLHPIFTT